LSLEPASGPPLSEIVDTQRTRAKTLVEMAEKSRPFYGDIEGFDEAAAKKHLRPVALDPLTMFRRRLETLDPWTPAALHGLVETVAAEYRLKLGKVAQPLRVALTGSAASPSIDATVYLIGRERCLTRLDRALAYIEGRAGA